MADKPNDRPKPIPLNKKMEEPKIFVIIDGKKFPRPGLETFFAGSGKIEGKNENDQSRVDGCASHLIGGGYCSCNKVTSCSCVPVCSCQSVCTCVGHRRCSCVGHISSGGCRCAPVH